MNNKDEIHLYHTSQTEIKKPDIYYGRKNADFGQGFYLTPDKEFALRWAKKNSVINEYILDTSGLSVHRFVRDEEWFSYIYNNRQYKDNLDYDIIIGPIANDTIYNTYGIITSGFVKTEQAVKLLSIGNEYIQYAIKSEQAASQLVWINSIQVDNVEQYRNILIKEEEEYQKAFAEVLLSIN